MRAHVPVFALAAAVICWTDEVTPNAKRECKQVWRDAPLLSASVVVDGKRAPMEHEHAKGKVRFGPDSLFAPGAGRQTYYGILRGAIIGGLEPGTHSVVAGVLVRGRIPGIDHVHPPCSLTGRSPRRGRAAGGLAATGRR